MKGEGVNKSMEAIKQIVRIPKDHEIGIKIPQYVPENETGGDFDY